MKVITLITSVGNLKHIHHLTQICKHILTCLNLVRMMFLLKYDPIVDQEIIGQNSLKKRQEINNKHLLVFC